MKDSIHIEGKPSRVLVKRMSGLVALMKREHIMFFSWVSSKRKPTPGEEFTAFLNSQHNFRCDLALIKHHEKY